MKTLKISLVLAIIFMVVKAYALKPMAVPQHIQQEAAGAVTVHQGMCDRNGQPSLCMVGYKQETDTFYLLYFNDEGVLIEVTRAKDGKEQSLWKHPQSHI